MKELTPELFAKKWNEENLKLADNAKSAQDAAIKRSMKARIRIEDIKNAITNG